MTKSTPSTQNERGLLGSGVLLFSLAAGLGSLFFLPEFITAVGEQDCTTAEEPASFGEASEDDCAELSGVAVGEKSEYITVQMKVDGPAFLAGHQDTIEDAIVTKFDMTAIIPGARVPKKLAAIQESLSAVELMAVKLSKNGQSDLAGTEELLDSSRAQVKGLVSYSEFKQEFAILERSRTVDYSGPNPAQQNFFNVNLDPDAFKFDMGSLRAGLMRFKPNCRDVSGQIEEIRAIEEQLTTAYAHTPPQPTEYKPWPELKSDSYSSCLQASIPHLKRLAWWYELEQIRQAITKITAAGFKVATLRGKKIKLPSPQQGKHFALDITPRKVNRRGLVLFPILALLGLGGIVALRRTTKHS